MALTGKNLWLIKSDKLSTEALLSSTVNTSNNPKVVTTTEKILYANSNVISGSAAKQFTVPLNMALISKVDFFVSFSAAHPANKQTPIVYIGTPNATFTAHNGANKGLESKYVITTGANPMTYVGVMGADKNAGKSYCNGSNTEINAAANTCVKYTCNPPNNISTETTKVWMCVNNDANHQASVRYIDFYYNINGTDTLVYSVSH